MNNITNNYNYYNKNKETPNAPSLIFPDIYVDAANVLIAISIFRTFKENGLLTEEEFFALSEEGNARWREIIGDDTVSSNPVVPRSTD